MTMVLDDIEAEDGFCPFKSCGISTKDVPSQGVGKVCPNCFRFAVMSQKRRESVQNRLLYEVFKMYEETSASTLVSGAASHTSPVSEDLDMNQAHVHGPKRHVFEIEDIELCQSIQVIQTLLDDEIQTPGHFKQNELQSSGDVSLSPVPSTYEFKMHIFVKNLAGKSLVLRVNPSDTVKRLKDMIHERERVPQGEQRLIFAGKRLEDQRTLSEYKIQKDNTIYLVAGLRSMRHSGAYMSIVV